MIPSFEFLQSFVGRNLNFRGMKCVDQLLAYSELVLKGNIKTIFDVIGFEKLVTTMQLS